MPVNTYGFNYQKTTVNVKTTAQNFTASWVDLGNEVDVEGYNSIALWFKATINNSANLRLRVLAKLEGSGSDEYSIPLQTVSPSDSKIEPLLYELNNDEDSKYILELLQAGHAKTIQIQIQAGTVGATAATIDSAIVTLKKLDERTRD